jgi:uncharacterized FlaG/YvyC family protein
VAETIRDLDSTAKIAVNLLYCPLFNKEVEKIIESIDRKIPPEEFMDAFKSLRDTEGVPLDILGMDYYKGG